MKTAISCVIDRHPRFLTQAWLLLASLRSAGIAGDDPGTALVVHVPRDMANDARLDRLRGLGAVIEPYDAFAEGPGAYCNKLVQFRTGLLQQAERVLLLDADLLFLRDPRPLFDDRAVRAKIVDSAQPPAEKWRPLFAQAGFPDPATAPATLRPDLQVPARNCNGGAYFLPRAAFAALAEAWPRWSRHCLAQQALLGDHLHHADQLGFALAMQELDLPFLPLDVGANFPTHFRAHIYQGLAPQEITAMHYHRHVDAHGMPAPTGIAWVDRQMMQAMNRIRRQHSIGLDNAVFWETRYATDPELGSGLGSRGEVMLDKRRQLAPVLTAHADRPVVDIGCGDLEVMHVFGLRDYRGFDLSASGLDLARAKRPDWSFTQGASGDVPAGSADLAICLDVAIHQSTPEAYRKLVDDVVAASRDAVLISGYETAPQGRGIVFFREPLSQTLAEHPGIAHVTRIGGWRDVALFLAERGREGRNPHDIRAAELAGALATSPHPQLLVDIVAMGRRHLGFFPKTIIRCIEYPWIAARMPRPEGLRVLDMGAGVAPLPLWLAQQGARVTTVDGHSLIRTPPAPANWNEWGYLDYGLIDDRIRSHNCLMQDLPDAGPFDLIYSVSVIEHIPAEARRAALAAMRDRLVPGGRLLLTLDLIPGTDRLWDLSEGKRVDEDRPHGTIAEFRAELEALGLTVTEQVLFRAIAGSRTDLLMVDARL
ncbi:Methyltransferase domain-containing protein [Paracoccus halophilus]|uniref:Methyltransferase domain-containing protein n=1 Tax=Paracoccus halophilus TaxID=376733 RepID=A0A1I0TE44_9RHOB|nr:class I SAM-dependent methyltransferase [Paracoccus halophilus]SFA50009.1 Methyltransferase domain-containing protein [Paracoccus halophilus]